MPANRSAKTPTGLMLSPTLRRGLFLDLGSKITKSRAKMIFATLRDNWIAQVDLIAGILSTASGQVGSVPVVRQIESDLEENPEGTDVLRLDYPRYQTQLCTALGDIPIDVRICVALCLSGLYSKIWIRLGIPLRLYPEIAPDVRKSPRMVSLLRDVTQSTAAWYWRNNSNAFTAPRSRKKPRVAMSLDMTVLGTNDGEFGAELDTVAGDPLTIGHASQARHGSVLFRYLGCAAGKSQPIRPRRGSASFWALSPSTIELPDGSLTQRNVICRISQRAETMEVLGVGFDADAPWVLAQQASIDLSRWIGSRL